MVDHPDFCSERELEKAKATLRFQLKRDGDDDDDEDDEAGEDPTNGEAPPAKVKKASATQEPNPIAAFDPSLQSRSLTSIRSGVTVAMVAVALGFACCESGAFSSKWLLQHISEMTNFNFIFSSAPNIQVKIYSIYSYTIVRASGQVRYGFGSRCTYFA
jgi:hypothetical protein